ncbi:glycosyltransferase [Sphingosinicellaceae bacterium]|nr:glycosyltransferase [Sphingosinicellaceae bacterium]
MSTRPPLDVTVIVPTFNRAHYLGECLDALLGQTTPPRQIIIVDDGSTDDTAAVAEAYAGRVEYLKQPNGGKATALNLGLEHAVGADIWIFDDDDYADPDALRLLHEALHSDPDAGYAFGRYDNFSDEPGQPRRFMPVEPAHFEAPDLFCALLERCFVFQPALLVRRRCYDAVGGFDTGFVRAQDYEMLTRLALNAAGIEVPSVVFHQRQHFERRGSAAFGIDGREVWERQKTFDARVLEKVYRTFPLHGYLPRPLPAGELTAGETLRALLRRAAAMARKKLWRLAGDDIAAATTIAKRLGTTGIEPAEAAMLGRVFDEHGYGRDDLNPDNPFLREVRALPASRFRSALIAALSWPIFRYTLLAVRRGKPAEALGYARLYREVGASRALPDHLRRLTGRIAPSAQRQVATSSGA